MTQAFNDSWEDKPDSGFTNNNYRYNTGGRILLICQRCGCMVSAQAVTLHDAWHDSTLIEGEFIGEGEIVTDQPSITEKED